MPRSARKKSEPPKAPLKKRKQETTRESVIRMIHEIRNRITDEETQEDLNIIAYLAEEEFDVLEEVTYDNSKEVLLDATTKLPGANLRILELDSIMAEAEFDTFLEEFKQRHLIKIYND